jgi:hypothetical protein
MTLYSSGWRPHRTFAFSSIISPVAPVVLTYLPMFSSKAATLV